MTAQTLATPSRPRIGLPTDLLLFAGLITLARLILASAIPLTEDEAYYRLWAQHLQLGYHDHPPMIAWWIRAGMILAGDTSLGVRLVPALSSGLTSLLVFDLARRIGAAQAASLRAAIWFNATLLIGAGGFLAVPDAADVPFWTLALWCLARTSERPAWWLAAGVAAGLSCLSKYSGLFLAPGVLVWLALTPGGLKTLRTPWPWAAAILAGLVFAPNVVWNATHHWASFDKQFGRIKPGRLAPQFLLELLIGQIVLLNPIVAGFAVRAIAARKRLPSAELQAGVRLLLATCAPFVAYLVLHSLHDRVQAHWPAPLYPAAAILAAIAAQELPCAGAAAVLRRIAAPLGLGLSALVLLHLALPATDLPHVRDPSQQVRGWPILAEQVERARTSAGAAWVGTLSYGTTGQLADQPLIKAPIAELGERDRYPPGDLSWGARLSQPGLVVDLDRRVSAQILARCFAAVTLKGDILRGKPAYTPERYAVFLVSGPKSDVLHAGC